MSAVAVTATDSVVASFKAVKLPVGCAKTGGGCKRGEVRASGIFDCRWQSAVTKRRGEKACTPLKLVEILCSVFCHVPRIFEAGCVEVADDDLSFAWWRCPATPIGCAVGKEPGEQEGECCRLTGSNRPLLTYSSDGAVCLRLRPELAVCAECITEEKRGIPPGGLVANCASESPRCRLWALLKKA